MSFRIPHQVRDRYREKSDNKIIENYFEPWLSESRGYPRAKASKGEAVVFYCEPLATKDMGIIGFPRRWRISTIGRDSSKEKAYWLFLVNKMEIYKGRL